MRREVLRCLRLELRPPNKSCLCDLKSCPAASTAVKGVTAAEGGLLIAPFGLPNIKLTCEGAAAEALRGAGGGKPGWATVLLIFGCKEEEAAAAAAAGAEEATAGATAPQLLQDLGVVPKAPLIIFCDSQTVHLIFLIVSSID